MISNLTQDLFYAGVKGRSFIDRQTLDAASRLPDCTFVFRPDSGNTYAVYFFSKNNILHGIEAGELRPQSRLETAFHVTGLGNIFMVEQENRSYVRQRYYLGLRKARNDNDYQGQLRLRIGLLLENMYNAANYRLTLESAHQRAKNLAVKKAKEVAEKENVIFIEDIVTES